MTAFTDSDIAYTTAKAADWAVHLLLTYDTVALNRRALAEQDIMLRTRQNDIAATVTRLIDWLIQLGDEDTAERLRDWLDHIHPQEVPR